MPVFDAYLIVDWSAAGRPVRGANSIWLGLIERRQGRLRPCTTENIATRHAAHARILDILTDWADRGVVGLAGFDFAMGYPRGVAKAMGLTGAPWRALWTEIAANVRDDDGNRNNRFEVAAAMNRRISGAEAPFWGRPRGHAYDGLAARKPQGNPDSVPERRLVEKRQTNTKPVWQLYGNGAVGGQVLTGLPMVRAIRNHRRLEPVARVWPFETGLAPLARPAEDSWRILLAEVYPSLIEVRPKPGEIKDQAQVRRLAEHFGKLDDAGRLGEAFAGDPGLTPAERRAVEREEGWILGVGAATVRYDYLRDPAAIYRRSFAAVGAEAALNGVPRALAPIVARLVHACGMPDIVADLGYSHDPATAGRAALAAGAPVVADCRMVAAGIDPARLPAGNRVRCLLDHRGVARRAAAERTTRSAAAVSLARDELGGAVVAIGNAPTALFRLLELLADGAPRPALILAFPVGFVGAAESKQALIDAGLGVPYLTLRGRRGGSALAVAAVNALARGTR